MRFGLPLLAAALALSSPSPAQTATYQVIGSGCPGTLGVPGNIPLTMPRLGTVMTVMLTNLPVNAALIGLGWARYMPPLDLTPFGMPCFLHVNITNTVFLFGQGGVALFNLAIPSDLGLLGVTFYTQAGVFDAMANLAGMTTSDAARAVIGF